MEGIFKNALKESEITPLLYERIDFSPLGKSAHSETGCAIDGLFHDAAIAQ